MVERADGVFGDQIKLLIKMRFAKARIAGAFDYEYRKPPVMKRPLAFVNACSK